MPAVPGLRSPYESVGGLFGFPRTLDKIKLFAAGKLPEDYHSLIGDSNPRSLDALGGGLLGIKYADLVERTLQGGTDEEILTWAFERGRKPSEDQLAIYNAFMQKRGWRDQSTEYLQTILKRNGFPLEKILTFPDMMDFDEERPLRYPPDPALATERFPGTVSLPGLRSPYEMVGGIVHFPRMLDKMRLAAQGRLPPGWEKFRGVNGPAISFDSCICRFLNVDYTLIEQEALKGGEDEAILAWAFEHGRKPSEIEIEMFNAYLSKRGWRDEYAEKLQLRLQDGGFPLNAVLSGFDFIDLDEGRPLRFPG